MGCNVLSPLIYLKVWKIVSIGNLVDFPTRRVGESFLDYEYLHEFEAKIGTTPNVVQISLGIIALFEKIYDGEPILTIISNIGEDVHYHCFN